MITGKVASLIDERTVAINVGSRQGVHIGMRFMIYDASGKKIIDPDSNKELGRYRIKKRAVKAVEVNEKYSIAETYKSRTVNEGGSGGPLGALNGYLSPPRYVTKFETFVIDDDDKKALDEERSIVKVGDIIEEIADREFSNEDKDKNS